MQELSILITTLNGARTLGPLMEALTRLTVPVPAWRIVVVDNGSTDGTPGLLQRYAAALPLVLLREERRGMNIARNAGLEHVKGELVVFTDDDTIPARDWLVELVRAAEQHPECDIFGGAVVPLWPSPPPAWITDWVHLSVVYAKLEGLPAGPIKPGGVFGPNFAIRARALAGQRFDPGTGPDGTATYAMGAETEFVVRLGGLGHRCYHVPTAVVQHTIRPNQMERPWILQRAFRYGRLKARLSTARARARHVAGIPGYLYRRLGANAVVWLAATLARQARTRFDAAWAYRETLGYMAESRALHARERAGRR